MCVYVTFHKEFPLLAHDPVYQPIHVGKAISQNELGFNGDNTGDHISERNPYYSELTGLYWIWKNTDSDWIGLCHYRRFFFCKEPLFQMKLRKVFEFLTGNGMIRNGIYYTSDIKTSRLIATGTEIKNILAEYDAIVPVQRKLKYPVWKQYQRRHHIRDMERVKEILSTLYPSYTSAFDRVMEKKELFSCNMFVMKREFYNQYMSWLFSVLFELEKLSDITQYDAYQKRMFGFISERLFDVWLTHNNLNYKTLPFLYFKMV
jgi:hypothetical protein